jgi:hypothetical protein
MVFAAFPRSGPPPRFRDYSDYAEVVGQLERTGCIADYTHIWWDIRLHPRLGTVEIRICDAVTRVEDAVALAAYCQALVKQLSEQHDRGEEIPSYHRILTTENKWLAARYGLEAPVMDLGHGARNRIPVAQLIRRTLKELQPHARELGSDRELEGIGEILSRGNGADRQLRVFNANRDIARSVEEIAKATEGRPGGSRLARASRSPSPPNVLVSTTASRLPPGFASSSVRPPGGERQAARRRDAARSSATAGRCRTRAARGVECVDEAGAAGLRIQRVCPGAVALRHPRPRRPVISSSGSRSSTRRRHRTGLPLARMTERTKGSAGSRPVAEVLVA